MENESTPPLAVWKTVAPLQSFNYFLIKDDDETVWMKDPL